MIILVLSALCLSTLQLMASRFTKLNVVLGIAVKYLGNHTNPLKW